MWSTDEYAAFDASVNEVVDERSYLTVAGERAFEVGAHGQASAAPLGAWISGHPAFYDDPLECCGTAGPRGPGGGA